MASGFDPEDSSFSPTNLELHVRLAGTFLCGSHVVGESDGLPCTAALNKIVFSGCGMLSEAG